jgi:tetratricopeptide (TPR) repeat protein
VISGICITALIFLNIIFRGYDINRSFQELNDTSSINKRNENLFANARTNPDLVIPLVHQTLRESKKINYPKGEADASLTLGLAWFTKYFNKDDSALYYYMQAYDLYRNLDCSDGKARACFYLAYVYSLKGDIQEAERYASLSLNFFEEAGDNRGMVNAYNALAYFAQHQIDYKKAVALLQEAIYIAKSTGDTIPLADVTNSLGNTYYFMTLFNRAIDTYFEALKLWEAKGDSSGIAIAYGSIGLMYYHQEEWNKALEFCFKKLAISKAKNDLWEVSKIYNTIASTYNAKAEYDSALIYFREALKLDSRMNYPSRIASSYNNIASTLLLLAKTDSAEFYRTKALEIASKIKDPELVDYYVTYGNILKTKGRKQEALRNLTKAYNMASSQKLPLVVRDASKVLSDLYSSMNRDDIAYKYLKEYYQLKDSISNADYLRQVTRMELQYDYDKKQKAAEYERLEERMQHENQVRNQRLVMTGLGILILLVILFSFFLLRHSRLRSLLMQIDLEQRLLRAQMNPHFIFNSLCAVQDFILADKPQNANIFLSKIARLMRNILENSREEFIPLEKEIETVKLYLDLQQLRFETEFDYDIRIDDAIDPENISIPPMLTQPCVENSVEHGLLPLKQKGILKISYELNNGLMKLEVIDNGIGRKEAATRAHEKKSRRSISGLVTQERLENFRKTMRKKDISFEIIDLYEKERATGTKVVMMLPYKRIFS